MESGQRDISEITREAVFKDDRSVVQILLNMTTTALKLVSKGTVVSEMVGKAVFNSPERFKILKEAGAYLKDLREVAGLTREDVSLTLQIADESLLTAVESGTATLSFELILRLSALLARHDPVPFIIKLTRTYNPGLWEILEKWGVGRLPLQLERERQFLNIYRSRDRARALSDKDFQRVLAFTESAFQMALDFTNQGNEPS